MTQDLKLTVYGLATDTDSGTQCYIFEKESDINSFIWNDVCPDGQELQDFKVECGDDLDEATSRFKECNYRWGWEEHTIDLTTIPAVAALVERVKVLEAALAPAEGVIEWAIDNGGNKAALTAIHAMVKAAYAAKEGGAA